MGRYAALNPSYRTAGAFSASIYLPATKGVAAAAGKTAVIGTNPTISCSTGTASARGEVFELRKVINCSFGLMFVPNYNFRASVYQASIPCLAGTAEANGNRASIRTTVKAQRAIALTANPDATIVFTGLVPGILRNAQAYGRRCTPIMPDSVSPGKGLAAAFGRQANRVGTDVRVRCARYRLPATGYACSVYRGFRVDGLAYPAIAGGFGAGVLSKRVLGALSAQGEAHGEPAALQLGIVLPFGAANAAAAGRLANILEGGDLRFPDDVLAQTAFVRATPSNAFARINRYGVSVLAPLLAASRFIRDVPRQAASMPRRRKDVFSLRQ